jgi:drug/metabolite transporter (DMT)-like permease
MIALAFWAPHNHFDVRSLPTLSVRIVLEVLMAYLNVEAIIKAERSTVGFLRLVSIPLLLIVDITLGYHITPIQIGGVLVMFFALMFAFHHNPAGRRGAWLAALSGFVAVATVSLYKFDITHYNSVPVEQAIVMSVVLSVFYIGGYRRATHGLQALKLLFRPVSGTQAFTSGLSAVLGSYAIQFAPASVVIALKRTFALLWAVLFGHTYFREHSLRRKLGSFAFTAVGIVLLVNPQWH